MSDLISKTIRFPAYMVDYIESFPGETFSAKLMYVLNDYRGGDELTRSKLEAMRNDMSSYAVMLERLKKDCVSIRSRFLQLEIYLSDLSDISNVPLPELPPFQDNKDKSTNRSGVPPDSSSGCIWKPY